MAIGVTAALPAAAATPCTWTASDLPMPWGAAYAGTSAASPNGYIAAAARVDSASEVVVWHDRVPTELPPPPAGTYLRVAGINNRGDVVGRAAFTELSAAYAYIGGVYHVLPSPARYATDAIAINDHGDVVGYASNGITPAQVILWPADAPGTYQLIATGDAVGIDNDRHVVTQDGRVWSPDGTIRKLPGDDLVVQQFHNGRIVGRERAVEELIQWDVTGTELGRTPGVTAAGINAGGLLAAWYYKDGITNTLGAWRGGTFLGDVSDYNTVVDTVTDDDLLVGAHAPIRPDRPWVPTTLSCS